MKLLTKTILYIITIALFIFLIGGFGFYKLYSHIIDKRVENELTTNMEFIKFELQQTEFDIEKIRFFGGNQVAIVQIAQFNPAEMQFSDTILYDTQNAVYVPYRKLIFQSKHKNKNYRFTIHKSLINAILLVEHVALGMTLMALLFILSLYFLNRYIFKTIWADFFSTINKLQAYDLGTADDLELNDSMIIEFKQLNEVIGKMTKRISRDFMALKEFTGNVTHEIQTPLAIIQSKAELLLQSEGLSENNMKLICDIYEGTSRLSGLSKALVLLTKIEHHQFHHKEIINIEKCIDLHAENFEDLFEAKNITYSKQSSGAIELLINPELANILIINLMKNALRHNIPNGTISVDLSPGRLLITNTGIETALAPSKIFDRFTKNSDSKNSLGLGLAIVKKICDYYNFSINYSLLDKIHCFEINFKK